MPGFNLLLRVFGAVILAVSVYSGWQYWRADLAQPVPRLERKSAQATTLSNTSQAQVSKAYYPAHRGQPKPVNARSLSLSNTRSDSLASSVSEYPDNYEPFSVNDSDEENSPESEDGSGEAIPVTGEWDFDDVDFDEGEFEPWFDGGQPAYISYAAEDQTHLFENPVPGGTGSGVGKTLYVANAKALEKAAAERDARDARSPAHRDFRGKGASRRQKKIDESEYEVQSFQPGTTDHPDTPIMPSPDDIASAVQGPDFDLASNPDDTTTEGQAAISELRKRVVSFGHGGEMVLRVKSNGWVIDGEGADFSIFENVFRIDRRLEAGNFYQEFATVSVSEDGQSWVEFPCDPARFRETHCAGAHPTQFEQGGDRFNLAVIGVSKIRYIKIRDNGNNKNFGRGLFTEGFDLDALQLHHAYILEE